MPTIKQSLVWILEQALSETDQTPGQLAQKMGQTYQSGMAVKHILSGQHDFSILTVMNYLYAAGYSIPGHPTAQAAAHDMQSSILSALKDAKKAKNLSHSDIASRLQVSHQAVSSALNPPSGAQVRVNKLDKLCKCLDVNINLGVSDPKETETCTETT